ncbi:MULTISPECIES: hypothetical protein [Streptomyces]|uniref:Uncharacterized protein n=2 Tax=Streptomyces TaxID=1883 RepID=A0ABS9JG48_9ACTN|nr:MULTISPECIES: hypothetical protein [Streptomyces]MYU26888.1 hypothetical protein [Streptomyces sp. SID7810]CUW25717.1 hypothetical protein TUE45_00427 [Streptomyces reticuli]AKN74005.1 hypothetical protein QR97_33585 [Streptomyces sp. PBH53]MCG0064497.1 hypothetical protein [Streptomyces tricolor]OYP13582.1 hypothetical protein CFC35_03000 [Streptomyces sp. FBKL.4005]
MSTSTPEESRSSDDVCTPDALLHSAPPRDVTPEDMVMAAGRDVTPKNLDWARRKLESEGPAAIEKLLP